MSINTKAQATNIWLSITAAVMSIFAAGCTIYISSKPKSNKNILNQTENSKTFFSLNTIILLILTIIILIFVYLFYKQNKKIKSLPELSNIVKEKEEIIQSKSNEINELTKLKYNLTNEVDELKESNNIKNQEQNEIIKSLEKRINEKDEYINIIEINSCKGLKPLENNAKVSFDIDKKLYKFKFEKKYKVISEKSPDWIEGQFYCNTCLTDKKAASDYYQEHKIKWEDIKFKAYIQILSTDEEHQLKVENLNDNFNYILYQIHLLKLVKGRNPSQNYMRLKKDTEFLIKYTYEVSPEFWGSYLNRYITFFDEFSNVTFAYPDDIELRDLGIRLHITSLSDGKQLFEIPCKIGKEKLVEAGVKNVTINLNEHNMNFIENKGNKRFIIEWDSEPLFGIPRTAIGVDESKLTTR